MRDRIAIIDINTKKFKAISYKQYDVNNILQIVITENGKIIGISNYSAKVCFQLPSGIVYEIPCIIENNTIKVILTKAILNEYGKVIVEVELTSYEQMVTTFSIYLNVEKSINKEISQYPDDDNSIPEYNHYHENMEILSQITQEMIDSILEFEELLELDVYATKDYVQSEIEKIDINTDNIDLSNYYTKEEVDEKIESIDVSEQLKDFATKEEVSKNTNDINKILEIIDEPPTYVNPTLTISSSSTNIEHNTQTNVVLTPRFTQNDAGAIISYSLSKDGKVLYTNTTASAYTDAITLQHGGSTTYTATVNYGDGIIKNTLLGIEYSSTSIKEGSISNNVTVRGYALSYYGVIEGDSISDTNGLSNVLRTSKGSTLTFNMTNQRVIYMYPKSFGNLTSIKDANNFDYINSYTLTNMTLDNVEYNVYILTDAVTINGFKQIFN